MAVTPDLLNILVNWKVGVLSLGKEIKVVTSFVGKRCRVRLHTNTVRLTVSHVHYYHVSNEGIGDTRFEHIGEHIGDMKVWWTQ